MKNPKRPTLNQKKIISLVGLEPNEWFVRMEDKRYLHLVDKNFKTSIRIIDKDLSKLLGG